MSVKNFELFKALKALRKKLSKAHWKLNSLESINPNDISVRLYLHDPFDSGESVLAGITKANVKTLSVVRCDMNLITASLDVTLEKYFNAKGSQRQKWLESLSGTMALYMLETKTFKKLDAIDQQDKYKHFIIVLYRNPHTKETVYRPISLIKEQEFLSQADLSSVSKMALERDKDINPDFLPSGNIVDIKSNDE